MNYLYRLARRLKDSHPILRQIYSKVRNAHIASTITGSSDYQSRLAAETRIYKDVEDINVLPQIFHYWSNTYLRPMLEEYGFSNPDQFFAKYLRESADACGDGASVFISIGSGNCDTEVRVARLMRDAGLSRFVIECMDMNPHMLQRGREMAEREGVVEHIGFVESDFNKWKATKRYTGAMANQSLHHVLNLEGLFDEVKRAVNPRGLFVTSDIIGRNGHQRWPEALSEVHKFWQELPSQYRYNRQLDRHEELYYNWDCSKEGFEGIRAQDIVPLLLERFDFQLFIGFCNVIDVFIDRSFGHNFKADQEWDRMFIDRLHAFDEEAFQRGALTPTHMMAVLTMQPSPQHFYARGLSPMKSVRKPI
ncbi:MAG TPA: class I SAM-dependent methyltransferase [Rudaea sp.]|nr:class I SAM-dependent methyltransferase [Rudaea sp.]